MGLDYSYNLFFPRAQLWNAVTSAATLAQVHPQEQTVIEFPDHELILPLKEPLQQKSRLSPEEFLHSGAFAMSLFFHFDDAIRQYVDEWREDVRTMEGKEQWEPPIDAQGRVAIGYIYLNIYQDLNIYSRKDYDPNLVMLSFIAATTSMSRLFEDSTSIRDTFTRLLMLNHGTYGLLDRENDAVLIWWRGQVMSKAIGDSWLSQREIESIVDPQ